MKEMTQRQREVLGFMRGFSDKHGAPPTVREIAERFHFTPRAARDHLRQRSAADRHRPAEVVIRGGLYERRQALALTGADGGSEEAPVTYRAALGDLPGISFPVEATWARSTFWLSTILIQPRGTPARSRP